MDAEEELPGSFLRVDEFNESNGRVDGLDLSDQQVPEQSWIVDAEELGEAPALPTEDPADTGQPAESRSPSRPGLRRGQWAPTPQQPPPSAPLDATNEDAEVPTDSLSLAQLRRIVQDMPKKEATPYAFRYEDTSSFEEEVEELFDYSPEERTYLATISSSFEDMWERSRQDDSNTAREGVSVGSWTAVSAEAKTTFLAQLKSGLVQPDETHPCTIMQALNYLALGNWKETVETPAQKQSADAESGTDKVQGSADASYEESKMQVQVMKENLSLIAGNVGLGPIFDFCKSACLQLLPEDSSLSNGTANSKCTSRPLSKSCGPRCSTTVLFLLIEHGRRQSATQEDSLLVKQCKEFAPKVLHFLTSLLAEMRWNESSTLPLLRILPLYWKTILTTFGGIEDANQIRAILNSDAYPVNDDSQPVVTASPLDYHLFRQEIISKYPAFDPPKPLFPFESDDTSMVPPLREQSNLGRNSEVVGPASVNGTGSSILHQPVHIATPAPSPPPSPAGPGGKGIKKQNYQTNQMFPFLYPPLDDSSNQIGGKGGTELQDLLVGRKWEGSDVPTSILEAANIFASRMRATHSMKQLWNERLLFMKYERGYLTSEAGSDVIINEDEHSTIESEIDPKFANLDDNQKKSLQAVEEFYRSELPSLQSVIIVLLKVLLQTVTALVTQPNVPNGLQTGFESPEEQAQDKLDGKVNGTETNSRNDSPALENLNTVRSQEIMGKSVSGILILLLKWFKLSHILKFEYLGQLLLDSNYVQLILKLFTHQELDRVINNKCEKKSLNFFNLCRRTASTSQNAPQSSTQDALSPTNEDAAIPPPIPRHNDPNSTGTETVNSAIQAPEVDELGYSTSEHHTAPITQFSWRAFFSTINHLRVLQKIVKKKPHRQLLMVQYKYSNILKKSLKVPQPDIRLYTLKIIKGQVPYCHRKWRQSNMRIITAIYLECKPELRDDWLAGLTMEEEVGEALPQEQTLRSLTYWYNLRRYPEAVTGHTEKAKKLLEEEHDFFVLELQNMEAALGDSAGDVGINGEVDPLEPMGEPQWTTEDREALTRTRDVVEQGPQAMYGARA